MDAAGRVAGLEHIDHPRALPAVAVAAEGHEHDCVFGAKLRLLVGPLVKEVEVGFLLAPTVEPDPERRRLREIETLGDPERIGLDGAVERGAEAVHGKPPGGSPRELAPGDRLEAFRRFSDRPDSVPEIGGLPPLVVLEGELDSLDQHLDLGAGGGVGEGRGRELPPQVHDLCGDRRPCLATRGIEVRRQFLGGDAGWRESASDGGSLRGEPHGSGRRHRDHRCDLRTRHDKSVSRRRGA